MSEEISPPKKTLIAFEPTGLKDSQDELRSWLTAKFNLCLDEEKQFEEASAIAKKNEWRNAGSLHVAANRAKARANYYDKALAAVEAGYLLIPPFPLKVFAVRSTRLNPDSTMAPWSSAIPTPRPTPHAAKGEGRYVSTEVKYRTGEFDEGDKTVRRYWATEFMDVEFPFEAVKPELMERASEAMALGIFDEIGLVGENPKRDPILAGSIVGGGPRWRQRRMNFFLAWWLDKESL